MRTTSSIAFFCRKSKANKSGYSPLECSVAICGQRKFFNLPMKYRPEEFNKKRPSPEILEVLDLWRTRINTYMADMLKHGMVVTAASLRQVIQQGGVRSYTIGRLFEDYLTLLRQRIGIDLKPTVFRKYELTAEKALKIADKDADISTLSPAVIKAIETSLKAQYDASTVAGYLVRLKCFCRYGQDIGKIVINPFQNIRIVKPSKPIKFLTEDEVMDLLGRSYKGATQRALDMFLVACGTGLSYSDLQRFSVADLKKEGDYYYISKQRNKTGRPFNAIVLPFALPIIFHYGTMVKISNQKLNKALKRIDKTYTVHMGRRTYASLLYNRNVSAEVVAAALGDSVQVALKYYAKMTDSFAIKQQINALKI